MTEYHCKYDELVDPSTLVDHPRNVNKHPRRQLDALSAVIWGPKRADGTRDSSKALGWRHAIVVSSRSGFVTMGHARKTVGIEEGELVPIVYQDFESEAAERAMLRADNRIAELAEIDFDLEQIEIAELAALDVPVLDFGFEISSTPEVVTGKEKLSGVDYGGIGSDSVPLLFMDIGGNVKREVVKALRDHLETLGAEADRDNGEVISEFILKAIDEIPCD